MSDKRNAGITPAMLLAALRPGGIEASEKMGQIQLVRSTNMPLDLQAAKYGENGKPLFEAAGFTFGKPVDDIFQEATLPDEWKRESSEHAMWSYIVDAKGRRRCSVFYKAAFYDRKAHAGLNCRYSAGLDYSDPPGGEYTRPTRACIFDAEKVIMEFPIDRPDDYKSGEVAREKAVGALTEQFPDWLNPLAYWD